MSALIYLMGEAQQKSGFQIKTAMLAIVMVTWLMIKYPLSTDNTIGNIGRKQEFIQNSPLQTQMCYTQCLAIVHWH